MAEIREPADRAPGPVPGAASGTPDQIELLGFMLSDEQYALDILEVKEIVRLHAITPVPRSQPWLKGIVTLRGIIVPIFDLRTRLGLAAAEHDGDTRIVVVYRGEEFAGLIVDRITQVMRLPVAAIELPPQTIGLVEAEFLRGVVRFRDQLVILLNLAKVVEAES